MKAIIYTEYGAPSVLRLTELDKPTPGRREVLVRIHATSVNYGDLLARQFGSVSPRQFNMPWLFWAMARLSFGLRRPRNPVLGSEFSGQVEAVGQEVRRFAAGDEVFGYLGPSMGAYAEYVCVPEDGVLAHKPSQLSHTQAAVTPYGAVMALGLLRGERVQTGEEVLIVGASGGIGSAALQMLKARGARVTAVCSAPRADYVRSLGADEVIDYARQDAMQPGKSYDLILDILGTTDWASCKLLLKPHGRCLRASFKTKELWQMAFTSLLGGKRLVCTLAPGDLAALLEAKTLLEDGTLRSDVDAQFPLAKAAAAHEYARAGARGKVAIAVADNEGGAA